MSSMGRYRCMAILGRRSQGLLIPTSVVKASHSSVQETVIRKVLGWNKPEKRRSREIRAEKERINGGKWRKPERTGDESTPDQLNSTTRLRGQSHEAF